MVMVHRPVLLQEVLQFLDPKPNENFIDATLGEGGHAGAILEKTGPNGIVLGIDRDGEQIERAKNELSRFGNRVVYVHDAFGNISEIVRMQGKGLMWQGIVFDLGWSAAQLEKSGRGFSFEKDEPLNMRYNPAERGNHKSQAPNHKQITLCPQGQCREGGVSKFENPKQTLTAAEIVNTYNKEELEKIIKEYGEERFERSISNGIIYARKQKPIETTFQLVEIIKHATPIWYKHRRIHFATRTFQALRIAVNDEWEEIQKGLSSAIEVIAPRGRILLVSFHSGEDRIVKQYFLRLRKEGRGTIITKKPLTPSRLEIETNTRARSAKLRVFEKI
ncbi:MAG: 16S rRNA (cytosine(1402)-N(4))-methyltransferase RsmH [Candidatus Portnoybacteria bacterium]|nr:16S rRNA (cytosine(1402)-N(4))-methyltransferase RsmH [Candidatus Portnoybacteria bacterium]